MGNESGTWIMREATSQVCCKEGFWKRFLPDHVQKVSGGFC